MTAPLVCHMEVMKRLVPCSSVDEIAGNGIVGEGVDFVVKMGRVASAFNSAAPQESFLSRHFGWRV